MDPESGTTDAAAVDSVYFVASVNLHAAATHSRCYDRSSSFAGIFFILKKLYIYLLSYLIQKKILRNLIVLKYNCIIIYNYIIIYLRRKRVEKYKDIYITTIFSTLELLLIILN